MKLVFLVRIVTYKVKNDFIYFFKLHRILFYRSVVLVSFKVYTFHYVRANVYVELSDVK